VKQPSRLSSYPLISSFAIACSFLVAALLLAPAVAAAADTAGQRWIALPDLDEPARQEIVRNFHARGTRSGLTLVVASEGESRALLGRFDGAIDLGAFDPSERLYFAFVGEGENPEHGRTLHRRGPMALVALPEGADPHSLHGDSPSRLFHDGVTAVPSRRQQPQTGNWEMRRARAESLLADPIIQSWVNSVSRSNLEDDVTTLSTQFTTRTSNDSGGEAAQDWIFDRFVSLGLNPTLHSFDNNADNVIAEIPGVLEPEKVVIIGAHYDSINFFFIGGAPGADDNASGTSAVLEIARILAAEDPQFRYTLRFILFASEEFGLVGSNAYSGMLQNQGVEVIAMLNTDMNAYRASGDALDLDFVNNDTTSSLTSLLRDISADYVPDLPTRTGNLSAGSSDHASFFNDGFPAAFYFEDTGDFSPFIHTGNDELGNSANDFELSQMITKSLLAGAAVLAEPQGAIDPPVLALSGGCPGLVTFDIDDATPNASAALISGPSAGSNTVPAGACAGAPLGLNSPTLRQVVTTDGSGSASFSTTLPSGACGAVMQILDLGTCLTSDVLSLP